MRVADRRPQRRIARLVCRDSQFCCEPQSDDATCRGDGLSALFRTFVIWRDRNAGFIARMTGGATPHRQYGITAFTGCPCLFAQAGDILQCCFAFRRPNAAIYCSTHLPEQLSGVFRKIGRRTNYVTPLLANICLHGISICSPPACLYVTSGALSLAGWLRRQMNEGAGNCTHCRLRDTVPRYARSRTVREERSSIAGDTAGKGGSQIVL